MNTFKLPLFAFAFFYGLALSSSAFAHISIINTLYSNSYSQIEMAVPHGCEGFDTTKVEVTLPEGLTGVRPIDSVFGPATIEANDEGVVTKLTWTATKEQPYSSDSHAYTLSFRLKTPEAPFSVLHFPTVQTCEASDGNVYTSEWVGMNGHDHSADTNVLPAPSAVLYPKVSPGWHKFDVTTHLHDLSVFNNAEIVWLDSAAYSPNEQTMKLIMEDTEATVLEMIHPGSTIWIKY